MTQELQDGARSNDEREKLEGCRESATAAGGGAAGGGGGTGGPRVGAMRRQGVYEAGAALVGVYVAVDSVVVILRGQQVFTSEGQEILESAVLASQFYLVALWGAFGSWLAGVRIGLLWVHAIFVAILFATGKTPDLTEWAGTAGLLTCAAAVPLRFVRFLGFELRRETRAAGRLAGAGEVVAAREPSPREYVQFSMFDLLNWTAVAGVLIAMAVGAHVRFAAIGDILLSTVPLMIVVVMIAVATLAPRTAAGIALGVSVLLLVPAMICLVSTGQSGTVVAVWGAVVAPLVILRIFGIKLVNVLW